MTTTLWMAPRIGYLLTAALAGGRYDEAAARWQELDEPTQSDVITALGAQARLAVRGAGIPLEIDFTGLAATSCPDALDAAQSAYEGAGSWETPPCPHCRELAASALAEIQVRAEVAAGVPASWVDLICRGKAAEGRGGATGSFGENLDLRGRTDRGVVRGASLAGRPGGRRSRPLRMRLRGVMMVASGGRGMRRWPVRRAPGTA